MGRSRTTGRTPVGATIVTVATPQTPARSAAGQATFAEVAAIAAGRAAVAAAGVLAMAMAEWNPVMTMMVIPTRWSATLRAVHGLPRRSRTPN